MDGKLWRGLYAIVFRLSESKRAARQQFSDREIVVWFLWAVLNDRPIVWLGCVNSAPHRLRNRRRPSTATMSRRLKTTSAAKLLDSIERFLTTPHQMRLCKYLDGKVLPVGRSSKDPDARFGRQVKGYRLHVIADRNHAIYAWKVLPNNVNEVRAAPPTMPPVRNSGYIFRHRGGTASGAPQ